MNIYTVKFAIEDVRGQILALHKAVEKLNRALGLLEAQADARQDGVALANKIEVEGFCNVSEAEQMRIMYERGVISNEEMAAFAASQANRVPDGEAMMAAIREVAS